MKLKILIIVFFCLLLSVIFISCSGEQEIITDPEIEEETTPPPMEFADGDDLSYALSADGSSCIVIGLFSEYGALNIEIPESYSGMKVTGIAATAFASSQHLKSITIPDTVTHIGNEAFDGCYALENVVMSKNLEYIGEGAFSGCDSIKLFEYEGACYLGSSDAPYTILMSFPDKNKDGEITVHEDTKIIYEYAFADCSEVDRIILPSGLLHVGIDAFLDCYDLEYNEYENAYYLGNGENPFLMLVDTKSRRTLTSLSAHDDTRLVAPAAFYDCRKLTNVKFPNGIISIGAYAFDSCVSLIKVEFPSIFDLYVVNGDALGSSVIVETSDTRLAELFTQEYCSCTFKKN